MPSLRGAAALVGLLLLLLGPTAASAPKTDKVTVKNGDVITCEIKSLERGILRVGTDSMGDLDIEWEDVVAVSSDQGLLIETVHGIRYLGTLAPAGDPAMIEVHVADEDEADAEVHEIPKWDVVLITPIEKKFTDKLKADREKIHRQAQGRSEPRLQLHQVERRRTVDLRCRRALPNREIPPAHRRQRHHH